MDCEGDLSSILVGGRSHASNASHSDLNLPLAHHGPPMDLSGRSHALHNKLIQATSPKRRKVLERRRVCVGSAAGRASMGESCLPHDMWAWRKYGQKPIKGSAHPRGYYKCSSSKGCPARKQVERSQTEESMLIITYTSEHNHPMPAQRNALTAGFTRHTVHPPTNTAAAVEEVALLEAQREVQVCPNAKNSEEKVAVESSLVIQENYEQSKELLNYLFSELQDFDEGLPICSHMQGVLVERLDYEEDEAVFIEETSLMDPYNLFEWSSSPLS